MQIPDIKPGRNVWRWNLIFRGGVETNYEHYIINCGKPEEENKKKDYRYLGPYQSESEGFVYYDLFKVGYEAANLYKSSKYKATALICFNDDLAQGYIAGLQAIGLRVPEDISVMGIDGIFTRNHFKPKVDHNVHLSWKTRSKMCRSINRYAGREKI